MILKNNNIEMHSAHNEGTSVVASRFIRILMNKIYKYIISISKNMYIDKLDYITKKDSNKYHMTIKMNPIIVKSNTYICVNIFQNQNLQEEE